MRKNALCSLFRNRGRSVMLGTTSGFAAAKLRPHVLFQKHCALIGRTRRSLLALAFSAPLVDCIRLPRPLPFFTDQEALFAGYRQVTCVRHRVLPLELYPFPRRLSTLIPPLPPSAALPPCHKNSSWRCRPSFQSDPTQRAPRRFGSHCSNARKRCPHHPPAA